MTQNQRDTLEERLLDVLAGLSHSISYCATGATGSVLPGLEVEGVGDVGVPVSAKDAKAIIKQASQAPYGRGEETIVDTKVRRVWQLEPKQFHLRNRQWATLVDEVVSEVRKEFGIRQKVIADLYKLLVYEKGSFFAPHRDTEKVERMFATLVVCLPSKHEGGTLIVSHAGQSREIDFGGAASQFETRYAAFYADCEHEVRPITKGYRVCLVYNLAIARQKKQPVAPQFNDAIDKVAETLSALFADETRSMIAVPLLHQYSEAGLAPDTSEETAEPWEDEPYDEDDAYEVDEWDDDEQDDGESEDSVREHGDAEDSPPGGAQPLQLKGADRARVQVLSQAAEKASIRVYVALLTHWQSGYPDYGSLDYTPYGSRWDRTAYKMDISDQNPTAEFEEVFEEELTLTHWFDAAGHRQPYDKLTISEGEIVSDVPEEDRPFRQEVREATGNEGASMERWYHQAVVVLWPEARHFQVLANQGPANAVPALCEMVQTTAEPRTDAGCREFAAQILDHWESCTARRRGQETTLGTKMASALLAIGDKQLATLFFKSVLPLEYVGIDGGPLVELAELAGWKKVEGPLKSLYKGQKPEDYRSRLSDLVALYASLCSSGPSPTAARKSVCKSLADEVEKMLDRWDRRKVPSWQEDKRTGIVEPVLRGLCAAGAREHVKRFLARVTEDAEHYDLHAELIPAVHHLLDDEAFVGENAPALARDTAKKLRAFCVAELQRRTERELQPPADWSREAKLGCNCEDCRELARFLKDKNAQVLRLPRRKELRQHLHQQIDNHRIDLAHVTERRGSPHTLVCTKNQASYERRRAQFKTDVDLLHQLETR